MGWKELEIDNLPPDILTGEYEFEWKFQSGEWEKSERETTRYKLIELLMTTQEYRYRKPEPKAPTHEEIMTKWWFDEDSSFWKEVEIFDSSACTYKYRIFGEYWDKTWFTGRESADMPPEN
jgi:hypothetical protein